MSMGTVYDAYVDKTAETDSSDDRTDTASSASRMMVGHRHRQASHVIAWGIGNVTLSDVELAKDGSGRGASVSSIITCIHRHHALYQHPTT